MSYAAIAFQGLLGLYIFALGKQIAWTYAVCVAVQQYPFHRDLDIFPDIPIRCTLNVVRHQLLDLSASMLAYPESLTVPSHNVP